MQGFSSPEKYSSVLWSTCSAAVATHTDTRLQVRTRDIHECEPSQYNDINAEIIPTCLPTTTTPALLRRRNGGEKSPSSRQTLDGGTYEYIL